MNTWQKPILQRKVPHFLLVSKPLVFSGSANVAAIVPLDLYSCCFFLQVKGTICEVTDPGNPAWVKAEEASTLFSH